MGIYSIKKSAQSKNRSRDNVGVGIRSAYIRVVGIQVDVEGSGEGCFWCPSGLCWENHLPEQGGPSARTV